MRTLVLVLLISCFGLKALHAQDPGNSYEVLSEQLKDLMSDTNLSKKESKRIFKQVKVFAENGHADAACDLGILYKDGIGCNLNFNKAKKWFKSGAEKGSRKAAYSMGYLYLKGLGNIPQNYKKAVKWFKTTDYPMAIHWLAKCHYHGFGVPVNKQKGMDLLRENYIGNSEVLLAQWEHEMSKGITESFVEDNQQTALTNDDLSTNITGVWKGSWNLMDWSGEKQMRSTPLIVEVIDDGTGILKGKISTSEETFNGDIILHGDELVFPDLSIALRKRYTDDPERLFLDYRFTSLKFSIKEVAGGPMLSGNLETSILDWNEPGHPSTLRLQKIKEGLSKEMKDAFAEQTDHFIKVYPNPFQEDLLIHYTLDGEADIKIQLSDYYRPQQLIKSKQKKQKKGNRTVTFGNLGNLKSGLYLIQMQVNGTQHSRIVIKK